jgi:double-stranded uracil-DNA glycosylase
MTLMPPSHPKAESDLPDILASNLKVIFCGINPGLSAARHGHHFLGRGNRFWRVLHLAGFTPVELLPEWDKDILQYGYGLTTAVKRPSARADQLRKTEFATAAADVAEKIVRYAPRSVAFLGKSAYASMYRVKSVVWGRQSSPFASTEIWVLPNPSGLNRAFRLHDLVTAYEGLRRSIT